MVFLFPQKGRKLMSIAGIEKVKEAEAAADKIRKNAEDAANAIVAEGRKEARAMIDDAEKKAEAEYRKVLAKAEEKASKLYQDKIDMEQQTCEAIKAEGRKNLVEVVDTIVGKVVDIYGNS